MSGRTAIVFCVHHKPWLMMGTLLTTLVQDRKDADFYFVYNLGDGSSDRESYREYRLVAASCGVNAQLSPFDERVREVCRIRRDNVFEIEYENDHALDSGVWYKFIREGRWRPYDRVLFLGEGALLAHPRVLDALVDFSGRRGAHFVASGHEKRRMPRDTAMRLPRRRSAGSALDALHQRSIQRTFDIFCRDPEFLSVLDTWRSDFRVETQNHVPGVRSAGNWVRRARMSSRRRWGSPYTEPDVSLPGRVTRLAPFLLDKWMSRVSLWIGASPSEQDDPPMAYYDGVPREIRDPALAESVHGVRFHCEIGPEWYGCTVLHLMSNTFLARLAERLERFSMYDALDVPFSGSALELIWGFLPAWLGFDKWFTNGFHRVRKHFTTFLREDYPPEMAGYINRYHRGRLVVGWRGDYLTLEASRSELGDLRHVLPAQYF